MLSNPVPTAPMPIDAVFDEELMEDMLDTD